LDNFMGDKVTSRTQTARDLLQVASGPAARDDVRGSDTAAMSDTTRHTLPPIERHHWLNTVVGLIDSVWHLTPEEQYQTIRVVRALLERLAVPERGAPREIPASLALEVDGAYYNTQLNSTYDSGAPRPIRRVERTDYTLPVEVWCSSLTSLFTTAYPDLDPIERVLLTKTFLDLLTSLGADERSPSHIPEDVARVARESL